MYFDVTTEPATAKIHNTGLRPNVGIKTNHDTIETHVPKHIEQAPAAFQGLGLRQPSTRLSISSSVPSNGLSLNLFQILIDSLL